MNARDRLAKHLYLDSLGENWRDHLELMWDRHDVQRIDFDAVYGKADEILAILTEDDETARYRQEARDASRDSGRRLGLLLQIHRILETVPFTEEVAQALVRLIETETEH